MLAYWPDRKLVRDPAFEIRIFFLKIWIHAIPLVRPPTTRIRLAHGVPKSPCVACGAGAGEPSTARGGCRGWPSQRDRAPARAAVARRRDLSWARVRERNVAVQASGSRRRLGGGKFSWLQTIENKRNRIGIPANPPPVRGSQSDAGDRLVYPQGVATSRPSSAPFAGNRRGGGCGAGKFSNPQPTEEGP